MSFRNHRGVIQSLGAALSLGAVAAVSVMHCTSDQNAAAPSTGASAAPCTVEVQADTAPSHLNADTSVPLVPLDSIAVNAQKMIDEGRQTFRFDTFGDEAFWGDALKLHRAIAGAAKGGVGAGLTPKAALSVGLKVDVEALPATVVEDLKKGKVDLESVETTFLLLQANAVIGVKGVFDASKNLTSIGIQCALCHSTVDDSLTVGVGHRLDGWANRDLDVGAIVNLSPDLSAVTALLGVDEATVRSVLAGWGPGHFNAQLFLDGKASAPDGGGFSAAATLIPPAFGLAGVNLATSTGFGSSTYWNAFVANLEMHGKGTFIDPRLSDASRFPVAAKAGSGRTRSSPDLITAKLPALQLYQLAMPAPSAPAGSFDVAAAARGKDAFEGPAKCASCHVAPLFTEPGWNLHTGAEIAIDDFQSSRSPERRYRTAPLKGLFSHTKGGFYHDGRFATLAAVVEHYDLGQKLSLSSAQKADLVEYLKSL